MNDVPKNPGVGYEHEFNALQAAGWLDAFRAKRILEIGPRHGVHSRQLASLQPSELIMVQRPERHIWAVDPDDWLPEVQSMCPARLIMGDIVYIDADDLGTFDLIWCCGVIYHNVEQVRLLRRLFELLNLGGGIVLESEVVRGTLADQCIVQVFYPATWHKKPTITHLPSTSALRSWLLMCGFDDIHLWERVYPKNKGGRAVYTAMKYNSDMRYEFVKEADRADGVLAHREHYAPGEQWRID